jgi:hypothetical protein
MGDAETQPADVGGEAIADAPPADPVQQLENDAWFSQFLSENAEKLATTVRQDIDQTEAELEAAKAREKRELGIARHHHEDATALRGVADDDVKAAESKPWEREKLEDQAQQARRHAETEDKLAADAERAAAEAGAEAKRLDAEELELYRIAGDHDKEARLRHDQSRALHRAADDERQSRAADQPGQQGQLGGETPAK